MMIMMFSKHPNRDKGEKTISEGEIWDEKGGGDGAERTQKDTTRKKEVKMNRSEESIKVGKCPFLLWIFHTTWDTNWDQFYVFNLEIINLFLCTSSVLYRFVGYTCIWIFKCSPSCVGLKLSECVLLSHCHSLHVLMLLHSPSFSTTFCIWQLKHKPLPSRLFIPNLSTWWQRIK